MSKLLRHSNYLRYVFHRFSSITVSTGRRYFLNHHPLRNADVRSSAKLATEYNLHEAPGRREDTVVSESIDGILAKIDEEAKYAGRIRIADVMKVYEKMLKLGAISSVQSLYLIRSCGSILRDELPSVKTDLVQKIWDKLIELNVPLDASHYNSLLKVFIDNEHKFSPTDFLTLMEKNQIIPNRVTYQRLIDKYCEDGDLQGAMAILEYMKSNDMTINETVFNSLVKGHAKANDFNGVKNILELMRKSQLMPSEETYKILAICYAEKGDLENARFTIAEAKQNDVYLSNRTYLGVLFKLALSGQKELVDQFFTDIAHMNLSRQECVSTLFDLVNKDQHEVAYDLILNVDKNLDFTNGFTIFIKQLITVNKSPELVIEYCNKIKNSDRLQHIYQIAGKHSVFSNKPEHAIALYGAMQKAGIPLYCHYFWPIFKMYHENKNEQGIWDTLALMYKLGLPCNFDTYMNFVLPNISFNKPEDIISKVKELGQTEYSIVEPLFLFYCKRREYQHASYLARNFALNINSRYILRTLCQQYNPETDDNASFIQVLEFIAKLSNHRIEHDSHNDIFGKFFLELLAKGKLNKPLLLEANQRGLQISRSYTDAIAQKLDRNDPDLLQLTRNLLFGVPAVEQPVERSVDYSDDPAYLEAQATRAQERGGNPVLYLKNLFALHCKTKNLEKFIPVRKQLEDLGFVYTPSHYAMMINLMVYFNDLKEAEKLRTKMEEDYPGVKLDASKALEFVGLLIKSGKISDAKAYLQQGMVDPNYPGSGESLRRSIRKVLSVAADTGDADLTKYLTDYCQNILHIQPHVFLFEPLIRVHLVRDDIDKAIEEYNTIAMTHHFLPCRNLLLKKCIQKNDPAILQKVVDVTSMHAGKTFTLHELALSFIETGHLKQAQNVMQTLGNKVDHRCLEDICVRLFSLNKVTELEQLIAATKNLTHINRDKMYFYLLQLHAQNNNYQKGLEIWDLMQEENVYPSVKNLVVLADLLERNNQPVPFIVPSNQSHTPRETSAEEIAPAFDVNSELQKCFLENNVEAIVDFLNDLKKGHVRSVSPQNMALLVEMLTNKNCLHEIKNMTFVMSYILEQSRQIVQPLVQKYSVAGNIEELKRLFDFLPVFTQKTLDFNYHFCHAYIAGNRHAELLSELESKSRTRNKYIFSARAFQELLTTAPHLYERASKLVEYYAKAENFELPLRVMWLHHFVKEDYDKASEIFKANVNLFTNMDGQTLQIIRNIKSTENLSLAKKFVEFVDSYSVKEILKGKAYNALFELLVKKELLDEAVALMEKANKSKIPLNIFNPTAMIDLKCALEEKKQKFPFDISTSDKLKDDSSDSDSSDDEKK